MADDTGKIKWMFWKVSKPAFVQDHEWREYGDDWDEQRQKVLERDDYTCQTPGCESGLGNPQVDRQRVRGGLLVGE